MKLQEKLFSKILKPDYFFRYDWGTLTYLINDDYLDIKKLDNKIPKEYESDPVSWLFKRYDDASEKTGKIPRPFEELEKNS